LPCDEANRKEIVDRLLPTLARHFAFDAAAAATDDDRTSSVIHHATLAGGAALSGHGGSASAAAVAEEGLHVVRELAYLVSLLPLHLVVPHVHALRDALRLDADAAAAAAVMAHARAFLGSSTSSSLPSLSSSTSAFPVPLTGSTSTDSSAASASASATATASECVDAKLFRDAACVARLLLLVADGSALQCALFDELFAHIRGSARRAYARAAPVRAAACLRCARGGSEIIVDYSCRHEASDL
jgi:hypothetical protein